MDIELDLQRRQLRTGSRCVRLQRQPFEVLRLLLERPGDVVTREELRRRLWPEGTHVDFEHSVNAAVKRLRSALGDSAVHPRIVETLPRHGYRLMHDIEGAAVPVKRRQIPALPRLALLPFMNLSSDSAQDFFTDGLTEEMTAQLGRVCRGRITLVAPLTAVMFRGTASHALDLHETHRVDYLVDGSVRREGDRVRITARLIETAGETLLWSDVFERDVRDALSVQTEVAVVVARSLATELAAR